MIRVAKPGMPFEEELALNLLTTLVNAACLTRAGELRWNLLVDGWLCKWSGVESSSPEEGVGDGLAFFFPFPLEPEEQRCIVRLTEIVETEVSVVKEW